MIGHPPRKINPILTVVARSPIGRRHKIGRSEMSDLLNVLQIQRLVELDNGWGGSAGKAGAPAAELASAWADTCRGINVISVLADSESPAARNASSNPGSIRFDDPGSMHPLLRATLMFAPAALAQMPYGQIARLRTLAKRVLIVED